MSNRNPRGLTNWPPTALDLVSIIPLRKKNDRDAVTAERITSLAPSTLKKKWPEKVKQLSDKREGMSLGDALEIAGVKLPA